MHNNMHMTKLQFENKKQFKLTLPKSLILALGWKKGDNIEVKLDKNQNLILKRKNG